MISIKKDMISIIMNPTRLRIIQYLLLHNTATAGDMKEELTDIPPASLYRHIKRLEEAECIQIIQENRIRGAVEKVYQLVPQKQMEGPPDNDTLSQIISSSLLSIMTSFQTYLAGEQCDFIKDQLFLSTSTLLLSDEEFVGFQKILGEAINTFLANKPGAGRRARRFTFISSPGEAD